MFAPRQRVAATQIARVLRPDGRIGIASWTPGGELEYELDVVEMRFESIGHAVEEFASLQAST